MILDPSTIPAPEVATPPAPEPVQHNTGSSVRASWPFSTDVIRQNIASYPQDAQDALVSLYLWCIDHQHPIDKKEVAVEVKCSDNLLYKIYSGIYESADKVKLAPNPELIVRIKQFLALEKRRFEAGETEFVETPTYTDKIVYTCETARERNTVAFLWGPSHIGKTWGLLHYTGQHNHGRTVYTRLQAASGLGGMVRRIARDCGISDKSNTASLVERIKRALTKSMLLIVDECHLLAHTYRKGSFHNCCEVLREIYDETQCGLVLSWTDIDEVKAASQKELQQLWRRATIKVPLASMAPQADLEAIFEHNGLEFPTKDQRFLIGYDPATNKPVHEHYREVVRLLAKNQGLKAITERIALGRQLARERKVRFSWTEVMIAHLRLEKLLIPEGEWK